ncbi:FAD:protein FMN transferase [soil metagenome]
MGTTWSLRLDNPRLIPLPQVRTAIDESLARVITQMSHWEPASDVSRFNTAPAGSRHAIAPEFREVLICALRWAEASGNAIDPTIGALVGCWGFGPNAGESMASYIPSPEAVIDARARTGWQRLAFDSETATLLQPGGMTLDFSGIAKGFAVDRCVAALHAIGLHDLLMEIGGELRGSGCRPDGRPWQVSIETTPSESGGTPQRIRLADLAIATSGDRWHTREHGGRRWSHTIDPRSGEPVSNELAAVTVLHPSCMEADALATVLTVLGPLDGPAFAETHDIAARFVCRRGDALEARASSAWNSRATLAQ